MISIPSRSLRKQIRAGISWRTYIVATHILTSCMYNNIQFLIWLQCQPICSVLPQDTFEDFFILPPLPHHTFFWAFPALREWVCYCMVCNCPWWKFPLLCVYGIPIWEDWNIMQYCTPCNAKFLCQFFGCNMTADHKNTDNLQSAVCSGQCHSLLPLSPSYILNGKYAKNLPICKNFFNFFNKIGR